MRILILLCSFVFLFFVTNVKSEEIFLRCIFKNGYIVTDFEKLKLTSAGPKKNISSNNPMAEDVYLKIDTRKKVILESSLIKVSPKEWVQTRWSDNEINHAFFGKDPLKEKGPLRAINTYTLNRNTGALNEVWILSPEDEIAYRNWDCDKSNKKF